VNGPGVRSGTLLPPAGVAPHRFTVGYDVLFLGMFVAIRTALFIKYISLSHFHASAFCEMIDYAKVAVDLAGGDYFIPIVHGYGIPFSLYFLLGKLAGFFASPEFGIGISQFAIDCAVVPFTYLLGKAAFDRRTGLLAAFFAAVSPFYMSNASMILVSSAVFHVPALLLLFLAEKTRRPVYSLPAGLLFGLPDGGGRFAPFLFLAAALYILFSFRLREQKTRHLLFLGAGFFLSLVHLLAFSITHPEYFLSLFLAFTTSGFEHVEVSRSLYQQIPQKAIEFLVPFLLYNPICTLQLIAATFYLPIKTLVRKESLGQGERFVWTMIGILSFLLAFVFTQAEPERVLADIVTRPLRYFFIFMPLVELITAFYVLEMLQRREFFRGAIFEKLSRRRVALAALGALFLVILIAPPAVKKGATFKLAGLNRNSTLLTNFVPIDFSPYFVENEFAMDYTAYLKERSGKTKRADVHPMEFYSLQFFKGPLKMRYRFHGDKVDVRSWVLNFPVFSFESMQRVGIPTGQKRHVFLYFLKKKALWDNQRRYRERFFREAFEAQEDDWSLMKKVNPGTDWGKRIVFENDEKVVARFRLEEMAYRSLEVCFGRRDSLDERCDFTVPSSSTYLDVIGLGWKFSSNLTDPGDWGAFRDAGWLESGLFVQNWVENEFRIRTVPGRYRIEVEWNRVTERGIETGGQFPGELETEAEWRTTSAGDGKMLSTVVTEAGPILRIGFGRLGPVVLHRLRLAPVSEGKE
jgi:hypothetical protein